MMSSYQYNMLKCAERNWAFLSVSETVAVFSDASMVANKLTRRQYQGLDSDSDRRSFVCGQARLGAQELQEQLADLRRADSPRVTEEASNSFPYAPTVIVDESETSCPSFDSDDHVPHVGIGLHYGNCTYGNVGAPLRLDFTVIGPAVNLASRIESLCSELRIGILASSEFVSYEQEMSNGCQAKWVDRGSHAVKGFDDPISVYELCTS
jgi:Adenylate and Guanylate cyclase catalytic domain